MSSSFADEQKKTDPGVYHQVVALSAGMLNSSLYKMWQQSLEKSKLRRTKIERGEEVLSMTCAPPRVTIALDDSHNRHYFYHMQIIQGVLQVYEQSSEFTSDNSGEDTDEDADENPKPKPRKETKSFKLEGAELVFPVLLESEVLKPGNPDHFIWATSTGFTDEAFSISTLYLKFTQINSTYDEKRSTLPSKLEKNPDALGGFKIFLENHVKRLKGHNIVGYQIKPKNPNAEVARKKMIPTSMEYVAYPWKEGGTTAPENDDRNCLCILSMTDFVNPPQQPKLDYSGPFTEGGATLCLNRELLWDTWILEGAKEILQAVEIIPLQPYLGPPQAPKSYVTVNANFTVGSNKPLSSFSWTPGKTPNTWTWSSYPPRQTVTGTYSKIPQEAFDEASSQVDVGFEDGGSKVKFSGTLMKRFHHQNSNGTNVDSVIRAKWTAEFSLFACRSGTLAVTRATHDIGLLPLEATKNQNWWIWSGSKWELRHFDSWQNDIQTEFKSCLERKFGTLTNAVQQALEDRHKLFLPTGGAFTVREPKFNTRGDLLASLVYHDYDPPKEPSKPQHMTPIQRFVLSPQPAEEEKPPIPKGKCLMTNNACGDTLPPAWRVVPEEQKDLPERQPLIPEHELRHEVGKVISPQISIAA